MLADRLPHESGPTAPSSRASRRRRLLGIANVVALFSALQFVMPRETEAAPPDPNRAGGTTEKAGAGFGWVTPSNGAYVDSIAIDVPEFHGVEPDLALRYDSAGGNGFVGVGWSLDGVDIIERASPGKGTPRYDASDIWLLGGMPLLPCPQNGTAASCRAGGTHFTERETYAKVQFLGGASPAASSWVVSQPNGTRTTFRPGYTAPGGVFRYVQTEVMDPLGNEAEYVWTADLFGCCWDLPKSVRYPGGRVDIHWERRLDEESFANGAARFTFIPGRVSTIVVSTVDESGSASTQRAYRLTYDRSALTGRSRLVSVQEFGADVVLVPSQTQSGEPAQLSIAGGTSLPPLAMTYQATSSDFQFHRGTAANGWCIKGTAGHSSELEYTGDFNGDGKLDLGCRSGGQQWILYSNANGEALSATFSDGAPKLGGFCVSAGDHQYTADFNGDGLTDLGCNSSGTHSVALSTGTGFSPQEWASGWCVFSASGEEDFYTGDFNGDGKTDLGCHSADHQYVYLSTGSGFTGGGIWRHSWCGSDDYQFTGDFNGDGKTDLACRTIRGDIHVLTSTGGGFVDGNPWMSRWCTGGTGRGFRSYYPRDAGEYLFTGDFNGDGKTDLACRSGTSQFIALSSGAFFSNWGQWSTGGFCPDGTSGGTSLPIVVETGSYTERFAFEFTADFNGDGKTDLGCLSGDTLTTVFSTGRGFVDQRNHTSDCTHGNESGENAPLALVGDFDGDGRTDLGCHRGSAQTVMLVSSTYPDLLSSITNEFGGRLSVAYKSSASWPYTMGLLGRTVSSITVDDGRGGIGVTDLSYASGRYDLEHKAHLGFKVVLEKGPAISPGNVRSYTETTFAQTYASAGATLVVERGEWRDQGNQPYRTRMIREEFDYESTQSPPYLARPTGQRVRTYDGGAEACVETATGYDGFGNTVVDSDRGDCTESGDEATTFTSFVPNTSTYVVAAPALVQERQGVNASGPLLNETRYFYDGAGIHTASPTKGLVTRVETQVGPGEFSVAESTYDGQGNVSVTMDSFGNATHYEYDAFGQPTRETDPLGRSTTTTWDSVCRAKATDVDVHGLVTRHTYDALCRLVRSDEPDGGFVAHTFVATGNPNGQHLQAETSRANGMQAHPWTRTYLDGLGRSYRRVASGPSASASIYGDTSFDARGNVAASTRPYYWDGVSPVSRHFTTVTYDGLDRPIATTHPDGATTTTSHDRRRVTVTDEGGHQTRDDFDANGLRIAHAEWSDTAGTWLTTTYHYDARDQLIATVDPAGNSTTYEHDWQGRVTGQNDPDLGIRTWTYDVEGQVTEEVDALGQRTAYDYDALGRVVTKTLRAGRADAVAHVFRYDETPEAGTSGWVDSVTYAPANRERSIYDDVGRLSRYVRDIDGQPFEFAFSYDEAGNVVRTRYPDGSYDTGAETLARTYDGAGRLEAIPGIVDDIRYNAAGQIVTQINANGTRSETTYSPERGWLDALRTTAGSAVVQNFSYTRNAEGLVTGLASDGISTSAHPTNLESWSYSYDSLHELTQASNLGSSSYSEDFTFDEIGNISATSRLGDFTYPPSGPTSTQPHAVTRVQGRTLEYDANGNMVLWKRRPITYGGNRMPETIRKTRYFYDADNQRYKKQKGRKVTRFVTNDYEIAPDGSVTKYIKLDDNDADGFSLVARIVSRRGTSRLHFLHPDHQGSVNVITDSAGAVVLRRVYRPFGEILWRSSGFRESRGYTGHYLDAESTLLYMRGRYYEPHLGRFIQADEVIDGTGLLGLNRFAYVGNDPTNAVDPDGHWIVPVLGFAAGIAVERGINYVHKKIDEANRRKNIPNFVEKYYHIPASDGYAVPKDPKSGLRPVYVNDKGYVYAPNGYFKSHAQFARWFHKNSIHPWVTEYYPGALGKRISRDLKSGTLNAGRTKDNLRESRREHRRSVHAKSDRAKLSHARQAIESSRDAWSSARKIQGPTRREAKRIFARDVRHFINIASRIPGQQCTYNRKRHKRCA